MCVLAGVASALRGSDHRAAEAERPGPLAQSMGSEQPLAGLR
jgi:hypothetical protein